MRPKNSSEARAANPPFKGYRGFPGSICASPNSMVVHGIPRGDYLLETGDILSVDVGVVARRMGGGRRGDGTRCVRSAQVATSYSSGRPERRFTRQDPRVPPR